MSANPRKILFLILFFGFLVRIFGIGYGLPMWLVADEPPFVLGALKMIELKTVIPSLHAEEFRSVLYYPPYISYLYLPFFALIIGIKFLLFNGASLDFINYFGADLSDFFIASRFISIAPAVFSIYLIYKIAKNIFKDEWTGILAAFFMSTSLLNILLSITARQWGFLSLIYALIIYFLTVPSFSFRKRYFLSVLAAGIGMGIGVISGLSLLFIALYYIFFEGKRTIEILSDKLIYSLLALFILLSILPSLLYQSGLGFQKDLFEVDANPLLFLAHIFFSEPILISFFLIGLIFSFFRQKKIFWVSTIFISVYLIIFLALFRFEDRFLAPLLPIIAIFAGFGFLSFFKYLLGFSKYAGVALLALLLLPVLFSARLGYLAHAGDSRQNLRVWIERNIPENTKIITSVELFRLSSTVSAINEQSGFDPGSLRQVDRSERFFGRNPKFPSFYVLNISDLDTPSFYENMEEYSKNNSYDYIVLQKLDFRKNKALHERFKNMTGEEIISFGNDSEFSISDSVLGGNPFQLFETKELGPRVLLYKLKK